MDRRTFAKGVAVVGLVGLLGTGIKYHNDHTGFNGLWHDTIEFVEANNEFKLGKGTYFANYFKNKKLAENSKKFNADLTDLSKATEFYKRNGKVFLARVESGVPEYIIGDITKSWADKSEYKGKPVEYGVVLFEQSIDTLINKMGYDEAISIMDNETNNIFINMTQIKKYSHKFYKEGKTNSNNLFLSEFYQKIINKAKNNHKLLFIISPYSAFEKEFTEYAIRSSIEHEVAHIFSHEIGAEEVTPYLREIAMEPVLNSFTFLITNEKTNPKLYNFFKSEGYSKEDLSKMSSEERSKIFSSEK